MITPSSPLTSRSLAKGGPLTSLLAGLGSSPRCSGRAEPAARVGYSPRGSRATNQLATRGATSQLIGGYSPSC